MSSKPPCKISSKPKGTQHLILLWMISKPTWPAYSINQWTSQYIKSHIETVNKHTQKQSSGFIDNCSVYLVKDVHVNNN